MDLGNRKLLEMVRALCVVALVFLNFGHAPLAAGGKSAFVPVPSSFCGDPIGEPSDARGDPCQVCRLGAGMALPPPPKAAEFNATAAPLCYLPATAFALRPATGHDARPRAPPLA